MHASSRSLQLCSHNCVCPTNIRARWRGATRASHLHSSTPHTPPMAAACPKTLKVAWRRCAAAQDNKIHAAEVTSMDSNAAVTVQAQVPSGKLTIRCAVALHPAPRLVTMMPSEHPNDVTARMQLVLSALQGEELRAATLLLARAFATSSDQVKLDNATRFLQDMMSKPDKGVTLVGQLTPTDRCLLPPNKDTRLVGTVTLAWHADSKRQLPGEAPPPSDAVYLSNMAVDPKLRRQGVAAAMLDACEQVIRSLRQHSIALHVCDGDSAARALYEKAGYVDAKQGDSSSGWMKGVWSGTTSRRALMRKELQ